MATPIYFPILRAKFGEIDAIGRLGPTRSAMRPMLDFPTQRAKDRRPLGEYLGEKIEEITKSWGTSDEIYLDFSRYEPDAKLYGSRHFVDFVFEVSRQARLKAMPVTGPLSIRGPALDHYDAVSRAARHDGRGIAVRLPYEYFASPPALGRTLAETLDLVSVRPEDIDVYLDAEGLLRMADEFRDESSLAATVERAAELVQDLRYRRVIFVASSMPDSMTRHDKGEVLRIPRTEFRVWRHLVRDRSLSFLGFGDYGVVDPAQVESDAPVQPPSRVRSATEDEYVLHKGDPDDIRALSRVAIANGDLSGRVESWGANAVRECAFGYGDPGGPAQWVSRDTDRHITCTVDAVKRHIADDRGSPGGLRRIGPWLQESLGLHDDGN